MSFHAYLSPFRKELSKSMIEPAMAGCIILTLTNFRKGDKHHAFSFSSVFNQTMIYVSNKLIGGFYSW